MLKKPCQRAPSVRDVLRQLAMVCEVRLTRLTEEEIESYTRRKSPKKKNVVTINTHNEAEQKPDNAQLSLDPECEKLAAKLDTNNQMSIDNFTSTDFKLKKTGVKRRSPKDKPVPKKLKKTSQSMNANMDMQIEQTIRAVLQSEQTEPLCSQGIVNRIVSIGCKTSNFQQSIVADSFTPALKKSAQSESTNSALLSSDFPHGKSNSLHTINNDKNNCGNRNNSQKHIPLEGVKNEFVNATQSAQQTSEIMEKRTDHFERSSSTNGNAHSNEASAIQAMEANLVILDTDHFVPSVMANIIELSRIYSDAFIVMSECDSKISRMESNPIVSEMQKQRSISILKQKCQNVLATTHAGGFSSMFTQVVNSFGISFRWELVIILYCKILHIFYKINHIKDLTHFFEARNLMTFLLAVSKYKNEYVFKVLNLHHKIFSSLVISTYRALKINVELGELNQQLDGNLKNNDCMLKDGVLHCNDLVHRNNSNNLAQLMPINHALNDRMNYSQGAVRIDPSISYCSMNGVFMQSTPQPKKDPLLRSVLNDNGGVNHAQYSNVASPKSNPSQYSNVAPPKPNPSQYSNVAPPKPSPTQYSNVATPRPNPPQYSHVAPSKPSPSQYSNVTPPKPSPPQYSHVAPPQYSHMAPPHPNPPQYSHVAPSKPSPSQNSNVAPPKPNPSQYSHVAPAKPNPSQYSHLAPLKPSPSQNSTIQQQNSQGHPPSRNQYQEIQQGYPEEAYKGSNPQNQEWVMQLQQDYLHAFNNSHQLQNQGNFQQQQLGYSQVQNKGLQPQYQDNIQQHQLGYSQVHSKELQLQNQDNFQQYTQGYTQAPNKQLQYQYQITMQQKVNLKKSKERINPQLQGTIQQHRQDHPQVTNNGQQSHKPGDFQEQRQLDYLEVSKKVPPPQYQRTIQQQQQGYQDVAINGPPPQYPVNSQQQQAYPQTSVGERKRVVLSPREELGQHLTSVQKVPNLQKSPYSVSPTTNPNYNGNSSCEQAYGSHPVASKNQFQYTNTYQEPNSKPFPNPSSTIHHHASNTSPQSNSNRYPSSHNETQMNRPETTPAQPRMQTGQMNPEGNPSVNFKIRLPLSSPRSDNPKEVDDKVINSAVKIETGVIRMAQKPIKIGNGVDLFPSPSKTISVIQPTPSVTISATQAQQKAAAAATNQIDLAQANKTPPAQQIVNLEGTNITQSLISHQPIKSSQISISRLPDMPALTQPTPPPTPTIDEHFSDLQVLARFSSGNRAVTSNMDVNVKKAIKTEPTNLLEKTTAVKTSGTTLETTAVTTSGTILETTPVTTLETTAVTTSGTTLETTAVTTSGTILETTAVTTLETTTATPFKTKEAHIKAEVFDFLSIFGTCSRDDCSKPATCVCSGCKEATYCGTECQTADWIEQHMSSCGKDSSSK